MDYTKYQSILAKRDGKILTLTMNRPEQLNAVDARMHYELSEIFRDVQNDTETNVVVLTGAGRAFCAGGDLGWLKEMTSNKAILNQTLAEGKKIVNDILDIEKPVIAMVNGPAMGLGATMALFCDIIIASEKAKFADPHVKVGIVAGDGGCVIWPLLVGICKAKELLMTGDAISAKEAERMGLINKAVPPEELDKAVYELAQRLANGPIQAINSTKVAINKNVKFFTNLILDTSLALEGHTFYTQDVLEAINAFKEKRVPSFKGC
jgi:enoyl-CoA hydratase